LSAPVLKQSGKMAQKAFLIMLVLGIVEIVVGSIAMSVSLSADGIHSISTAVIFLIVWIGLHLSGRSPDGTFHFGYYRIEALGSLVAAFVLSGFGVFILFEAYNAWLTQKTIVQPEAVIIVALVAAIITGA
jgi:cation diffusion facilitator family transporter